MTRARKHLVCLDDTPYYHVTSRCVRRAFLCGVDHYTGRDYEHRRGWIEDRARVLSSLFSVGIAAYAIMSNHYHLVVKLDPSEADGWPDDEVLNRWTALFRGTLLVQRYLAGDTLSAVELDAVASATAVYRSRLGSLSWFMKCLNEPVARQANAEDGCTGHFWEARFHSQPLYTEQAVLTAMAYVDLNPVRAGMAKTPEASSYTSVRARLTASDEREAATVLESAANMLDRGEVRHANLRPRPLLPFHDAVRPGTCPGAALPMKAAEYLKLVDATGRVLAARKHARIDPGLEPILERLGITEADWIAGTTALRSGEVRLRQTH